ncbi:isoleucine--tRNA ligase [Patulibacter sp. SYSU D01012]|uniref:isoleucine--tRNA ligase n=1 Tax=Patulibacter sp. SYSU D01012 TaxID=2817381 RepID=UPI001B315B9B|nr:isoleucine--tRNA ligase [Patulibacter sp. SYSU D01012]
MSRRPVDANQSFPALEEAILERWRERDVFRDSMRRRQGAEPWVFYEGPPTANGRPGSHHVLSRAFKDVFPRFQTMRGRLVERKGGWDTHGLPVEIAVEKELGLSSKAEIEAYGIAEFNQRCRDSVFTFLEDWNALTERIAFWVDLDDAYRTLDDAYVEQVWGAIRAINDRGLLYEGHRVVPYCPRCGTALSSHEVAQGYKDVLDTSAYVRFPVTDADGSALQAGDVLLAWTTTPWTLPSNAALAVHPDLEYVRARVTGRPADGAHEPAPEGEVVVVAKALLDRVVPTTKPGPENAPVPNGVQIEVLDTLTGAQLTGARYRPPFTYIAAEDWGPRGNTVLPADFVTAEDGTGVVHTAVAFGADDYALGVEAGLVVQNPVRLDGTYDERITDYAGRNVKDVDDEIVAQLRREGSLWLGKPYEHSYPHCWRCGTPLIYYAKPSWYIATSKIRDQLVAANEQVTWHPEHVKHGRFGKWLEGNVDWALSRERYWGTPLPVWRCDDESCDHLHCVGSFAELEGLAGQELTDPHRPYVDDLTFACARPGCSGTMRRVPEVIDVWFDSGSMPFAQHGETLEQVREEGRWPADYICEAQDQTRGWFYSLLAIATLLQQPVPAGLPADGTVLPAAQSPDAVAAHDGQTGGGEAPLPPFRDVVCLGLILDAEGQKMSKSRGNIVVPWDVIDQYGADAFRWYFFTSKQPWDGYRFSTEAIGEGVRLFLRTLWNTYGFLVMYENASRHESAAADAADDPESPSALMDRWIRSRLAATVGEVTERLEGFDVTFAGRAIAAFVDDLSNWYVRRSRRRFWEGDPAALATLRECLVTVAQLLAPFTPFVADEIYDNLDGTEPSVHLTDWPTVGADGDVTARVGGANVALRRDEELEAAMATARETVQLGLGARGQSKLKVRQPLHEAVVVAADRERAAIERLADIVRDELNVHELRFVADADELGSFEVKPNYRALGRRFGKAMPQVAEAVAGLDPARAAATVRAGGTVGITIDGAEHELSEDDLVLRMEPLEGYQLEREGSHAVALELQIDDALRREGLAREVVHAIQAARKAAGLEITDRIRLTLDGDEELLAAAREHEAYVTGETLTVALEYGTPGGDHQHGVEVEGLRLVVGVAAAAV